MHACMGARVHWRMHMGMHVGACRRTKKRGWSLEEVMTAMDHPQRGQHLAPLDMDRAKQKLEDARDSYNAVCVYAWLAVRCGASH